MRKMGFANSRTSILLTLIGSPFAHNSDYLEDSNVRSLYSYAVKNRIRLLFLNSLWKSGQLDDLKEEREKLLENYARIQSAFKRVSEILESRNVDYAFFKSIRPYQEVTADIDILILGSKYKEVLRALANSGYYNLGEGPLSATFQDAEARISIDIYDDVGVSHIIYIDKTKLARSVSRVKLSASTSGRTLCPEADLLAVIAHSILKEHMYVLSEYYTTLHYLNT